MIDIVRSDSVARISYHDPHRGAMRLDVRLCQLRPVPGDVDSNAATVIDAVSSGEADVYLFPESFLTGYGSEPEGGGEALDDAVSRISDACRDNDVAVAVGTTRYDGDRKYNSTAWLSPDGDLFYDKLHLARFGIYSEDGFEQGDSIRVGTYRGIGFGLCICYDIFFPEIMHKCSLRGAAVNICSAASAFRSKPYLDRVLPARALENVTYAAYINNTGTMNGLEMHGCSRGLDPFGDVLAECGTGEGVAMFAVDTDVLEAARSERHHLDDFRFDML